MTATNNTTLENYPFLSIINYGDEEFVGIIQNKDNTIVSFYDYGNLKTTEEKKTFLELGEIWWWESNRTIPINLFLKKEWEIFDYCLKTFNVKEIGNIVGHIVCLQELANKRIKKRSIVLVKKIF